MSGTSPLSKLWASYKAIPPWKRITGGLILSFIGFVGMQFSAPPSSPPRSALPRQPQHQKRVQQQQLEQGPISSDQPQR